MNVVFDVFGTLLTFSGQRRNPYRHLMGRGKARLPFLTRNVPVEIFAEECGLPHLVPTIRRELKAELRALRLFDDVAPTLQALRAAGVRIGVCSNLAAEYGPAVRRLLPELDAYVLSYEVGAVKPDPAIYQVVCEALDCAPSDVLFVGDSRRADVEGPRAFGMRANIVNRLAGQTLAGWMVEFMRDGC